MRFAFMDGSLFLAMSIGFGVSGQIYVASGYVAIYSISLTGAILAFLYGAVFLKNSVKRKARKVELGKISEEESKEPEKGPGLKELCNLRHIADSFIVAFKRREGGMRHVVLILVALFGLHSVVNGSNTIDYSYARNKFIWESSDYMAEWWSTYSSITSVFPIIFLVFVSPFMSRVLKLSDMFIVSLAFIMMFASLIVMLSARVKELLYLQKILDSFNDSVTLGIRAALTKLVGGQDVGKVFACVGVVQAGSGFISPLYNLIYLETLDWHPGMPYCVAEMLLIFLIALSLYCWFKIKRFNSKKLSESQNKIEISVL